MKRGFIKRSTSWLIAAISAGAIMSSAIYVVYFKQDPKEYAKLGVGRKDGAIADSASLARQSAEPIIPVTKPTNLDPKKVELGRTLFHDPRLSKDGNVSCASCHDLERGGVDGLSRSVGVGGKEGEINAPSVYNSALMFRQFWDGRAKNLTEQVNGPITNPLEMATSWEEILPKLNADRETVKAFNDIYGRRPNEKDAIDAIVEFERSLITPSRFDRWLLGDNAAIDEKELRGYELFVRHGCAACHQGEAIGGNLFQRFGVAKEYYDGSRKVEQADLGRYNVTGREEDRYVFKVPTLRNVALSAPYFHDASAETLYEAVDKMGAYQLGVALPAEDTQDIALFLRALTGEDLQ
ncbi:MAG: cytochrome-c peroxidase [Helicobacteraceae bacterium]|nr:cytochrome-c peroxidase [Helicobacteraceae bacterium]